MKPCRRCTAALPNNAETCGECGASQEEQLKPKTRETEPLTKAGAFVLGELIGVVVLAGLCLLGAYVFSGDILVAILCTIGFLVICAFAAFGAG